MKKISILPLVMTLLTAHMAFAADEIHWSFTGQNSVTFDWRGTTTENTIGYGLTSGVYTRVTAKTPDPTPVSSSGSFWEANLTGLTANTRYYYSIANGTERSFRTPPAPGSSNFNVYASGNIGSSSAYFNTGTVQDIIANDLPSFVVGLGDLTLGSLNGKATIDQHFNDVMVWSKDAAYMPVWGDLEWSSSSGTDSFKNYKGRFNVPNSQTSPGSPLAGGEDWYWFDYGNTRFITLPEPWSGAWTAWNTTAGELMAQAQTDQNIKFIATFGHQPAYSSGHYTGSTTLQGILNTLGDTYSKYVLNINAHSNNYERSLPQHGVTHITAGTGGANLTQDGTCLWLTCAKPAWSAFRAMHLGALKLRFTNSSIEGSFICGPTGGGKNDVNCTQGSVMDTFTIASTTVTVAPSASNSVTLPTVSTAAVVTAAATTTTNLIVNPGFESGATIWSASSGIIQSSKNQPAHGGLWVAWLNGHGYTSADSLYQTVTIPATVTSATLSFWLHIDTAETTASVAYDKLSAQVQNSSGTVLKTLATYSNVNKSSGYVQKSFDLTAYKGQTIRIAFNGTEDYSLQTSFVLDDFMLGTTTPTTITDTGVPTIPASLSAIVISSSQINLSWASSTDDVQVKGYNIFRNGLQIATVTSGTAYNNTGLSPSTAYSYAVSAYDTLPNSSAQSTISSATTQAVAPPPPSLVPGAAFPGAQGGGAASKGGRGGAVIEVTNLNDSGTGSLRACVEGTGARTCVFRVSGTIHTAGFYITHPYLTIAGQTAPGGGIMIDGTGAKEAMFQINANNIVIRYLRIAKGYTAGILPQHGSNFNVGGVNAHDVIIDHCSVSWNQDDGIGLWAMGTTGVPGNNVTLSYNMVSEGLYPHSTAVITGAGNPAMAAAMTDLDMHHNLIMNDTHRGPILGNGSTRLVNNINYNMRAHAVQLYGGIRVDVINNLYKRGPMSGTSYKEIEGLAHLTLASGDTSWDSSKGTPSAYVSGNIGWGQTNSTGNQWLMAAQVSSYNGPVTGAFPLAWQRSTALTNTAFPIVAEPVATLEANLLPVVGASRRLACDGTWISNRDSLDNRLINSYTTNTGITAPISLPSAVGGYPSIAAGTPCADTDHDGMPDVWETARGLNPNSAADQNAVSGNGYTNLDNFLSWM